MNAVKGGATSMALAWVENNLTPPIPLRNKADTEKDSGPPLPSSAALPAQKPDLSQHAVKLTSLASAIMNNKNDKIGQQDTFKYFFEVLV